MTETSPIRTRIAPSPTGIAHVGTAWMSMFDLALARQTGGQFVVRIEDTDRTRFVEGAEEKIYEAFKWLGIDYDEGGEKGGPYGPYKQSERLNIYREYIDQLLASGHAYHCFCTSERLTQMREDQRKAGELPRYDRLCRNLSEAEVNEKLNAGTPYVVRQKMPDEGTVSWEDAIRGHVEFDVRNVDDGVLLKSDGFPTYHFAVVVDDHLMKISHVLRGEEWISSTPKHLLLYQAFGWQPPVFAHMPLIRNADKSKLSKRKNDVSILSYREKGYLPEALLNFIALLGWSHPSGEEFFSFEEFLKVMALDRIQKTGPIFDTKKLDWMNGMYIRKLPVEELIQRLQPYLPSDFPQDRMQQLLPLVLERLVTLKDIEELTSFFYRPIEVDAQLLSRKSTPEVVTQQLGEVINAVSPLEDWTHQRLEGVLRQLQEQHDYKKSQFFMMIRIAVTGREFTPPLFETLAVLGKQLTLERLAAAKDLLSTPKTV
ncbi:glutamate--tRNA ligase [Patescibacteria group bacterium]|nr:glutamate--tRNA ligase [Patescibacteria group bacterium]